MRTSLFDDGVDALAHLPGFLAGGHGTKARVHDIAAKYLVTAPGSGNLVGRESHLTHGGAGVVPDVALADPVVALVVAVELDNGSVAGGCQGYGNCKGFGKHFSGIWLQKWQYCAMACR